MCVRNATDFSVGCFEDDRYGISAEGRDQESAFSILLWVDRAVLHDAMQRAASSTSDTPVMLVCGCGEAQCTARIVFMGAKAVVERHDGMLHVALDSYDYVRFVEQTSEADEQERRAFLFNAP